MAAIMWLVFITVFNAGIGLNAQSLLWKISGNGLESPSYLYGTIHIKDKRVFAFDENLLKALEACPGFAMEILLNTENINLIAQRMVLPEGESLQNIFSPEDYQLIKTAIEKETGMEMSFIDRLKPFALLSIILNTQMAGDMEVTVDEWFYKSALEKGKKVAGLETIDEQMDILEDIPNEYIVDFFRNINKGKKDLEAIIALYCQADLNKLLKLMQKDDVMATLEKQLIISRNKKMADRIVPLITDQPTFIALGAGHIPGKQGIVRLLEKKGYTLRPVKLNKSACGA